MTKHIKGFIAISMVVLLSMASHASYPMDQLLKPLDAVPVYTVDAVEGCSVVEYFTALSVKTVRFPGELALEAESIGANAVIGVHVSLSEDHLQVTGTPVRLVCRR